MRVSLKTKLSVIALSFACTATAMPANAQSQPPLDSCWEIVVTCNKQGVCDISEPVLVDCDTL